jgi:hypothetical protein
MVDLRGMVMESVLISSRSERMKSSSGKIHERLNLHLIIAGQPFAGGFHKLGVWKNIAPRRVEEREVFLLKKRKMGWG